MAKEQCSPHGWTVDTLEEHFTSVIRSLKETIRQQDDNNKERFQAAKEQVTLALTAAEKAISKAEDAANKRFESVNEFRATLADQSATLVTRVEYTTQYQALVDKVTDAMTRISNIEAVAQGQVRGLTSFHMVGVLIISALALGATILFQVLK